MEYLPTFNSNVIELNIHRIKNLAKQFVLFNDDTFLCRTCSVEDFFYKGLPRDFARLSIQSSSIGHIIYNNIELINNLHIKNKVVKHHLSKWFSLQYGINSLIKTLTLIPWSTFPGFSDHHMPQPYLLSQFSRAWQIWSTELVKTCRNQFRDLTDLSHWLIRYDMLCRGEFRPKNFKDCKLLTINDASIDRICQDITNQHTGLYVLMIVQIFQILILYRSNLVKPFKKYYLKKQALNYNRTPYNAKLLQLELPYDLDNILLKGG